MRIISLDPVEQASSGVAFSPRFLDPDEVIRHSSVCDLHALSINGRKQPEKPSFPGRVDRT
jgi:hypothetical protein